jgi:hypothetical protein
VAGSPPGKSLNVPDAFHKSPTHSSGHDELIPVNQRIESWMTAFADQLTTSRA